jgi:hypothetical protein
MESANVWCDRELVKGSWHTLKMHGGQVDRLLRRTKHGQSTGCCDEQNSVRAPTENANVWCEREFIKGN